MTRAPLVAAVLAVLGGTFGFAQRAAAQEPAPVQPTQAAQPTQPAPAQPTQPAPAQPAPGPATEPAPSTPGTETKPGTPAPSAGAPGVVGAGVGREGRFRYANTWNLDLEGGAGYVLDVEKWTGFFRARPGVLIVRNDNFYQLGATAEYMGLLHRPAFGVQAEYLHLQLGAWVQIGAALDTKGRPGGMAAIGLSLFGVEAQVREFDQTSDVAVAFLGKIRIPIGILVYGLSTR
jgi:hypothetical protein